MRTLLTLSLAIGASLTFANGALPAKTIVDRAVAQAAKEHKSVMVIFHASWCGWCKRLDKWMETPTAKAFFDKEFVVAHLVVLESKDKKDLENPGGDKLMAEWNGAEAGLPFTVILGTDGKMVVNSNAKNEGKKGNIGCPWATEEQDWFFGMLAKARPKVETKTLTSLRANLVEFVKANGG